MVDYANCSDFDSINHLTGTFKKKMYLSFIFFLDLYDDMYTRTTHRVRKALFPEILLEDDLNGNDYIFNNSSVVTQFANPSVALKEAILCLLSFRDKIEDFSSNIPQLTQMLKHSDPVKYFFHIFFKIFF